MGRCRTGQVRTRKLVLQRCSGQNRGWLMSEGRCSKIGAQPVREIFVHFRLGGNDSFDGMSLEIERYRRVIQVLKPITSLVEEGVTPLACT